MIIDFHTHIFPTKIAGITIEKLHNNSGNPPFSDGTEEGLTNALSRANADFAVSLPVLTKPTQFDSVVRFALEINSKYEKGEGKILSFAGMHPLCEDIKGKMKFLKENGFKGVKIHPDFQKTPIDSDGYIEILKCAKDLDLIVVTHAGVDDGYIGKPVMCPPEKVKNVIKKVGHEKFVLAHYGGHKQWEEVLNILAGEKVYFDTAFTLYKINENLFKDILLKHGDDKVLFATDSPWRDIDGEVNVLKSFNLSKETTDKILYINAVKLLGLGDKYGI